MKHSDGHSEKFSSNQQKMKVLGKRMKQRYANIGREKQSIMKRSNVRSTKVKYWNIKEREHTDGLNEWSTG